MAMSATKDEDKTSIKTVPPCKLSTTVTWKKYRQHHHTTSSSYSPAEDTARSPSESPYKVLRKILNWNIGDVKLYNSVPGLESC